MQIWLKIQTWIWGFTLKAWIESCFALKRLIFKSNAPGAACWFIFFEILSSKMNGKDYTGRKNIEMSILLNPIICISFEFQMSQRLCACSSVTVAKSRKDIVASHPDTKNQASILLHWKLNCMLIINVNAIQAIPLEHFLYEKISNNELIMRILVEMQTIIHYLIPSKCWPFSYNFPSAFIYNSNTGRLKAPFEWVGDKFSKFQFVTPYSWNSLENHIFVEVGLPITLYYEFIFLSFDSLLVLKASKFIKLY